MGKLFVYGLLLKHQQRKRLGIASKRATDAILSGYFRLAIKGKACPVAVPSPDSEIKGVLIHGLSPEELKKLDKYEGPNYERKVVWVKANGRTQNAYAYVNKSWPKGKLGKEWKVS